MRHKEIDGIRGWAALLVVAFHLFQETLGIIFPIFHSAWFNFIFDGHLMVLIFFILSGDALSISFFSTSKPNGTVRILLSRYLRLTFPILISCLLTYLLMTVHLTYNIQASRIVQREDWLGSFLNFDPSFINFAKYSLADVYFNHRTENSYNPFLWTMSVEMLGSIIIFLNIFILPHTKYNFKIIITQIIFFWISAPYLSLFIAGFFFGNLRQNNYFEHLKKSKKNWIFTVSFIVLAIFISYARSLKGGIELHGHVLHFSGIADFEQLNVLWAIAFTFLCYSSNTLLHFFKSTLSQFLGKISFPIYIIQFPIIASFTCAGILYAHQNGLSDKFYLVISFISLLIYVVISLLFKKVENIYLNKLNTYTTKLLKEDAV
ncbi:acyltransferase [Aquitalea sp. LB_tupeE]|uniref:acyltransferase family protein n=1 Tax=Aquitalea sp. LB_tupeE TaxID=2748078 RepID=UPI0015BA4A67|nr:acyltransferase [Aquitalea sp. LB_tupeE]NWK79445.1 acyltransferase [Aquitalea sp. LB_tupeE]